jgi:hypothetical protein
MIMQVLHDGLIKLLQRVLRIRLTTYKELIEWGLEQYRKGGKMKLWDFKLFGVLVMVAVAWVFISFLVAAAFSAAFNLSKFMGA